MLYRRVLVRGEKMSQELTEFVIMYQNQMNKVYDILEKMETRLTELEDRLSPVETKEED